MRRAATTALMIGLMAALCVPAGAEPRQTGPVITLEGKGALKRSAAGRPAVIEIRGPAPRVWTPELPPGGASPPGADPAPPPATGLMLVKGIEVAAGGPAMAGARETALAKALAEAARQLGLPPAEAEVRLRWIEVSNERIGPDRIELTVDVAVQLDPVVADPVVTDGWDLIVPVLARDGRVQPFAPEWLAAWRRPGATSHDLAVADGGMDDLMLLRAAADGRDMLDPAVLDPLREKYGARHAWFAVLWPDGAAGNPLVEFLPLDPRLGSRQEVLCRQDDGAEDASGQLYLDAVRTAWTLQIGTPPAGWTDAALPRVLGPGDRPAGWAGGHACGVLALAEQKGQDQALDAWLR